MQVMVVTAPEEGNTQRELRSPCAVAAALDFLGDRWSLLIVRDLLLRSPLRFQDFAPMAAGESIPTNTLADRLRRLERAGIVVRHKYQDRPARYTYGLTSQGVALRPVLEALAGWGAANLPNTRVLRLPPKNR